MVYEIHTVKLLQMEKKEEKKCQKTKDELVIYIYIKKTKRQGPT